MTDELIEFLNPENVSILDVCISVEMRVTDSGYDFEAHADDYDVRVVITKKAKPLYEEGWYQDISSTNDGVEYWDLPAIREYGVEDFLYSYQRMNPPTLYSKPLDVEEAGKYTDGYYLTEHGAVYRRLDGKWAILYNARWESSQFQDENIEDRWNASKFVPFTGDWSEYLAEH